jgi:hypothetical protein
MIASLIESTVDLASFGLVVRSVTVSRRFYFAAVF